MNNSKSQFNRDLNNIGNSNVSNNNNNKTNINIRKKFQRNNIKQKNNFNNYIKKPNNRKSYNNQKSNNIKKDFQRNHRKSNNNQKSNNIRKDFQRNDGKSNGHENSSNNHNSTGNSLLYIFFTVFSIVLLFFVVKLGYYIYVSDCNRKPLAEYLFSFSLEPCGKSANIIRSVLHEEEVFHISDQIYNYEMAKCKCASYGVRLATEQEIIQAYNQGANWCTYGWCEGGKAFYPVQTNYYEAIQDNPEKRNSCKKPGINGGVFNPNLKFGINCYGVKPKGVHTMEDIVDEPQEFCELDEVKEVVKVNTNDRIVSFNNDKWSKYD